MNENNDIECQTQTSIEYEHVAKEEKSVEIEILELNKSSIVVEKSEIIITTPITCLRHLQSYLNKFKGAGKSRPKRLPLSEAFYSLTISFIGILIIGITDYYYLQRTFHADSTPIKMIAGSFGATAVLLYGLHSSPYSSPRNCFGGHLISSFIGVSVRIICEILKINQYFQQALAVSISIFVMSITETSHPPGGATALIAVTGGPIVYNLGYGYMLTIFGGAFICISVALIGNNLIPTRTYPEFWW